MNPVWCVSWGPGRAENVTRERLIEMAAAGEIRPDTLVCTAGTQWFPAGKLSWLAFGSGDVPSESRRRRPDPRGRRDEDDRERARSGRRRDDEDDRERDRGEPPAPPTDGSLQFGTAFNFAMKDPKWFSKVAVVGLLQYVPILGFLVIRGWRLELARRVYRGVERPLPTWEDFGGKLTKGATLFGVWLLYQLPSLIGSALMFVLVLLPLFGLLVDSDKRTEARLALRVAQWGLQLLLSAGLAFYAFAADVMFLVAQTRYIATDRASAFFEIGANFRILRQNLGLYVRLFLLRFALGVIVTFVRAALTVTGIGAILMPAVTTPPLHWTNGHLFGQAAIAVGARREEMPEAEEEPEEDRG